MDCTSGAEWDHRAACPHFVPKGTAKLVGRRYNSASWGCLAEVKTERNVTARYNSTGGQLGLAISCLLRSIRSLSDCELAAVRRVQLLDQVVA